MPVLTRALSSVEAYVDFFSRQPLPVLRRTVGEFSRLSADIDRVTRQDIATAVLSDPMMAMRLLSHLEIHRKAAQNHDIVTIAGALVMMGVVPFFRAFGNLPTVEDALASRPQALLGLLKVISRACKAAHYARDWAVIRHDLDVNEITVAALLHEAAEMVFWINAPDLIQRAYDMQRANRGLRSATVQREIFGVTASEAQSALIRAWRLPGLLLNLLDASQADDPRVRTITLASDFARHLALGWDNAALPDDVACLSALLRIPPEVLLRRIGAPEEIWPKLLPAAYAGAFPASPG
ncbi:MAG: HDOD domain-containing protein [Azoarcus sp.]|jgi:HD-like signal output (HDOD) protein|nr:HDOD domain-containing protein [Azoarcus sp.]